MNDPGSNIIIGAGERPTIILAVSDESRRDIYLSALSSSAELILTETIRDIPKLLRQGSCKGILVDIVLKIRASHMDKVRIADSLAAMPSATLNLAGRSGSIRILMLNQSFGVARTAGEFIALCGSYQPAPIYPPDLASLRLNAIIAKSREFGPDSERTVTMFITGSGCFLFSANPDRYEPKSLIWIDFVGIADRRPVQGRVCWQCPWGVTHKVSGIYVEFEEITEGQYDEIAGLIEKEKGRTLC